MKLIHFKIRKIQIIYQKIQKIKTNSFQNLKNGNNISRLLGVFKVLDLYECLSPKRAWPPLYMSGLGDRDRNQKLHWMPPIRACT
jgi:hypothetical protein